MSGTRAGPARGGPVGGGQRAAGPAEARARGCHGDTALRLSLTRSDSPAGRDRAARCAAARARCHGWPGRIMSPSLTVTGTVTWHAESLSDGLVAVTVTIIMMRH